MRRYVRQAVFEGENTLLVHLSLSTFAEIFGGLGKTLHAALQQGQKEPKKKSQIL